MSYQPEQPAWQQPTPPPVQPPAPKRRPRWPWWIGGLVVALIVIAAIAGGNTGGGGTSTSTPLTPGDPGSSSSAPLTIAATTAAANPPPAPTTDTIVYTVTGGHAQDITWIGPDLQESQITDRTVLPWSKTFTAPAGTGGLGMSLDAQNAGGGTIGCSITVDGKVVASNSSSGQYALVVCTDTGGY